MRKMNVSKKKVLVQSEYQHINTKNNLFTRISPIGIGIGVYSK